MVYGEMQKEHAILVSIVALIWGGSFIAVKIGVEDISPIILAFFRFAIASPLMFFIMALRKKIVKISPADIPMLLVLSLTGVTLLYILQFTGIKYTSATNSALLINTNVLFIAIFSWIFLKEEFSYRKIMGVLLSFIGVVFVISKGSFSISPSIKGDILILLSALCWAIYSIVGKKLLEKYDSLSLTTYTFIIGTFLFIPFIYHDVWSVKISTEGWAVILYLAILCSVFAYVAWYYALEKAEATEVAIFLNLIPLFAMLLAHLVLKERITILTLIGASFIIYGIYITLSGKKRA
ncbi:MAG: DMT family transporter [Thermoplasmata archaeon]|nr:DMT family transporter [Thermoplasmata archaeon]